MSQKTAICIGLLSAACFGCNANPTSGKGFTLPQGDAARGQEVFIEYRCHECHTVSGVEMPELAQVAEKQVRIGGEVTRIQTYGELVTSIINPSHKLASGYRTEDVAVEGESRMTNYNDVMTVSELIDLVAFLQSRYRLKPFEPSEYPLYY
ncbi:MAG: c-type cytochrome [Planctomycetaceae bacterium]|nr:c-type cytochrome [Planctomycetaceae bacterium]